MRKYERCSAKMLNLNEYWLRDAIFSNPDLVIGPCRAAGLTEDEWYSWKCEYKVETGKIDVLLLSSQGRVAIVETKLSSNRENRRRVLAQVLDYLVHLADQFYISMPDIPKDQDGQPVADRDDIIESVAQGDVLVIIASDEVDKRATKLSQFMLGDHLTNQWDLALIDIALYRTVDDNSNGFLVIPYVRNLVERDLRQVVRVIVEGETPRARIEVERVVAARNKSSRQKWDEERFFRYLDEGEIPKSIRVLAQELFHIAEEYPDVDLSWGTGKSGSMVLKRRDGGLIEIFGSGEIRFRPDMFVRALGDTVSAEYRRKLERLAPEAMKMKYPRISRRNAANIADELLKLIKSTLEEVENSED